MVISRLDTLYLDILHFSNLVLLTHLWKSASSITGTKCELSRLIMKYILTIFHPGCPAREFDAAFASVEESDFDN